MGTVLLGVGLAAVYGLVLAVLAVIERATTGWGVHLDFFQVSYILAGPWYLTWLTSFVGLAVLFVYGIWWGLVYWRWDVAGLLVFAAAQVVVGAGGALAAARTGAWPAIGRFFITLSAAGLTASRWPCWPAVTRPCAASPSDPEQDRHKEVAAVDSFSGKLEHLSDRSKRRVDLLLLLLLVLGHGNAQDLSIRAQRERLWA
jgi:hypothetical protein